jgi:hypothetical protein
MIQLGGKFCTLFSQSLGGSIQLVRLIKICLNETYSKVRIGKHLSDAFTIQYNLKQRDDLSTLLFSFFFRICH